MILTFSIIAFLCFTVIFGRFADSFLFDYLPKYKEMMIEASNNHPDPNFGRRVMVTFTIMVYGLIIGMTYLLFTY